MAQTTSDILVEILQQWGVEVVEPIDFAMFARACGGTGLTIDAGQAAHFAESLARGEPNRTRIALTALSDTVRELT